jgi:hypothetical protein
MCMGNVTQKHTRTLSRTPSDKSTKGDKSEEVQVGGSVGSARSNTERT